MTDVPALAEVRVGAVDADRTETGTRRCEQCGREGVRGFRTIGGFTDERFGYIPPITECVARHACLLRATRRVPLAVRQAQALAFEVMNS